MSKLVVWHNQNNDTFYCKFVTGIYAKYEVGYVNQYNHKIVFVKDNVYEFQYKRSSLRLKVIRRLISFLQKIERKLL